MSQSPGSNAAPSAAPSVPPWRSARPSPDSQAATPPSARLPATAPDRDRNARRDTSPIGPPPGHCGREAPQPPRGHGTDRRGQNRGVPDAADEGRPLDDPADAAALAQYATALADGIEQAIPQWIDRSVRRVLADQGIAVDDALAARVADAGRAARIDGGGRVRALLSTDIDAQAGNPLAVLRSLVPHATAVLEAAGARPVTRDEFSVRQFPGRRVRPHPGLVRRCRSGAPRAGVGVGGGQGPRPPGPAAPRGQALALGEANRLS